MYTLVQGIHVVAAILLIMIVLFQSEEGSGFSGAFGASMGSGNSGKMFGKKGAAGVVVRFTAILVSIFLLTSFSLTFMVSKGLVESDGFNAPISSPISK
ncbi:MAG: preprotein translocase subunit SecG [Candidatus Cloacimonadota bacterium]|nr:MAG: preprotein translocase subunit SecG [Candidatus Cloacimonadota bacterium]